MQKLDYESANEILDFPTIQKSIASQQGKLNKAFDARDELDSSIKGDIEHIKMFDE